MIVAHILASKGRDVATTTPDKTISAAVAELSARRIGALVVMERGRLVGIVSERDIVRAIGLRGAGILDDPVSSIMTRDVVTCSESDTVNGVMTRMTRRRFRHMPVVERGKLCGLVSIGDVVKMRIAEAEMEAAAMREYIATG